MRRVGHMHPYHYSLIHHSLGVPLSSMQPPLYHLDIDNQNMQGGSIGEAGVVGNKFSGTRD